MVVRIHPNLLEKYLVFNLNNFFLYIAYLIGNSSIYIMNMVNAIKRIEKSFKLKRIKTY